MNTKVNSQSFKLLDNADLTLVADLAKQMYIDQAKPPHMEPVLWLAQCWFEASLSVAFSRGYIYLIE